MARHSKKEFIIEKAGPLFIQNGFKATSIDMVVKETGVSKPTVYNNFKDKADLMEAVIDNLMKISKPPITQLSTLEQLESLLQSSWLTNETCRWYAIVIGEGDRFPQGKQKFWTEFDNSWRLAVKFIARNITTSSTSEIEDLMDLLLMRQLKNL